MTEKIVCAANNVTAQGLVNPSLYYKMMGAGAAIFILVLAAFIFAYFYLLKRKNNEIKATGKIPWLPIILVSGLVLRVAIAIPAPGVDIDITLFINWSASFATHGLSQGYNYASSIDYPPGYMYCLYAVGMVARLFKITTDSSLYLLLIKLPPIIADIGIGVLIYKFCGNKISDGFKLFFTALWVFNPVVILDSAVWGQVDSVLALLLLVAIYFITKKKFVFSSIVFAVAISVKPQALILVPILGYALIKEIIKNLKDPKVMINRIILLFVCMAVAISAFIALDLSVKLQAFILGPPLGIALIIEIIVNAKDRKVMIKKIILLFVCMAVAISAFIIVILPYAITQPKSWILNLYLDTTGHYNYATVNAFNFFYLIKTNWIPDSGSFIGLTYYKWGMISIVVSALVVWWLYQKSRTNPYEVFQAPDDVRINKKKYRIPSMYGNPDDESYNAVPYLLASTLLFLVVTFGPRMHERYFFPIIALLIIAIIKSNNKYLLALYAGISTVNFFGVLEILTDLNMSISYKDNKYIWPDLYAKTLYFPRFLMSLFNVIFCLALLIFSILYAKNKFKSDNNKIWSVNNEENN